MAITFSPISANPPYPAVEDNDFDPELSTGTPCTIESDITKYRLVTIEEYKRTSKVDGKFSPVKFWEENRKIFPALSKVTLMVRKNSSLNLKISTCNRF